MLITLVTGQEIFYGEYEKHGKQVNILSPVRNQNQPKPCGASFAFAVTSAMSDQFNKVKDVSFPLVTLSPQMLMSCRVPESDKNCNYRETAQATDLETVLNTLKTEGVADESCNNWYADTQSQCDKYALCKDCTNGEKLDNDTSCTPKDYHSFKLKDFQKIQSDKEAQEKISDLSSQVRQKLTDWGPVVCNISHSKSLFRYRTSKITAYLEDLDSKEYNNWVSVVGYILDPNYPVDQNKFLWVVRLSFGDNVGYFGYIYLATDDGQNPLGILDNCYALQVNPDIELVKNSDTELGFIKTPFDIRRPRFKHLETQTKRVKTSNGLDDDDQPIFWGNVDGVNYLTWMKNQHIPTYCGSCWAQAATSVLSDRLNIYNMTKQYQTFPRHIFSVQALINCRKAGTCLGGDSGLVFELAKTWKVPTQTCRMYESKNPERFSCEGQSRCYNADKDETWELPLFNGIKVIEWKRIRGEKAIKQHLKDGPVACFYEVTPKFEDYKASEDHLVVYEEKKEAFEINHVIGIVGWGNDEKGGYWIVRNSWGSEFGYNGLFYMRMGNTLALEAMCQVPTKFEFVKWNQSD